MSQDSLMRNVHRTDVPRSRAADPAARTGKRAYNALNASSVGLELGLSVAIGLLAGFYMDKWLGTEPWLMLLWLLFGLVAGFRGVVRAVKRADRAADVDVQESGKLGTLGEQVNDQGGGRGNA
jgi:ATP synthase protein I